MTIINLVLLLLGASAISAVAQASTRHTQVAINIEASDVRRSLQVPAFLASWGTDLTSPLSGPIMEVTPSDACSPVSSAPPDGSVLVIDQGHCSFESKMENLSNLSPLAVIVVGLPSVQNLFVMGPSNISDAIPAIMVLRGHGQQIREHQGDAAVLSPYQRPKFDWSSLLLFAMALSIVFAAAYLGSEADRKASIGIETEDPDIPESGIVYLDTSTATAFVFLASSVLVALYFIIDYLIYVVIGVFVFAGSSSLAILLAKPCRWLFPSLDKSLIIPIMGSMNIMHTVLNLISFAVGICWFIFRKDRWSFILQDVLGAAILIMIQRVTRLPNIKVATILLVSAFFYDIFWVFLSPFFFKSSVMMSVATGGSSGESMPMLLSIPRLNDLFGGVALLGFGDIALPGLLITYIFRFDVSNDTQYAKWTMLGYALGLILTMIAMVLTGMGQPALLYLVPCTLGLLFLMSRWQGHLATMWKGQQECPVRTSENRLLDE